MTAVRLFDMNGELRFDGTQVGGGGSLPPQWTVDKFGNVIFAPDGLPVANANLGMVHIVAAVDAQDALTITDPDNPDTFNFGIDQFGYLAGNGADFEGTGDSTTLKVAAWSGQTVHDVFQVKAASSAALLRVLPGGGVLLPNLPTSDPAVADQLWNDAGTLKVSAG